MERTPCLEPRGLEVGPEGNVFIAGFSSDNAFRVTPAGTITEIIDSAGDGIGNLLDRTTDVAVIDDGRVYVVSEYNLFVIETRCRPALAGNRNRPR